MAENGEEYFKELPKKQKERFKEAHKNIEEINRRIAPFVKEHVYKHVTTEWQTTTSFINGGG